MEHRAIQVWFSTAMQGRADAYLVHILRPTNAGREKGRHSGRLFSLQSERSGSTDSASRRATDCDATNSDGHPNIPVQ